MQPIFTHIIGYLVRDDLYESAIDLIIDVLSNHSGFLTSEQQNQLESVVCSSWADGRLEQLLSSDSDFDDAQFGQLLLALGFARIEKLVQSKQPSHQHLLKSLTRLLEVDGFPIVDDKGFVPTVEFWCSFAEEILDAMYTVADTQLLEPALSHLLAAVSHSWKRITYPPPEEFTQWDSADRVGFHDARKDVIDLLQSTFGVAGPRIVSLFTDLVLEALASSQWLRLEAAVYCFSGLADCVKDDDRCDAAVERVFSSQLLTVLNSNSGTVPWRVRQTCVSLIENYNEYFRRHVTLLPPALNLLFSGLSDSSVANAASKSILRLCHSCRDHLHTEVESFLAEYRKLVSSKALDCLSSERVIGAVAAVAQACPDPQRQRAAIIQILNYINEDVVCSAHLKQTDGAGQLPCQSNQNCYVTSLDDTLALHASLRALRCLLAVAKAFQAPADTIDFTTHEETGINTHGAYQDDGLQVQRQIIHIMVTIQQMFDINSEVTELICNVLRCGFSESGPNPFVLPAEDVAQYITQHSISTPSIGVLVRAASSFVSSLHSKNMLERRDIVDSVLLWAIKLVQSSQGEHSTGFLIRSKS